jgi:endonuclease G
MKVKRSAGRVASAETVGFWFEHKQYTGSYSTYAVSVDEVEKKTGFDFFVNLPDSIENTAETNSSWSLFQSF